LSHCATVDNKLYLFIMIIIIIIIITVGTVAKKPIYHFRRVKHYVGSPWVLYASRTRAHINLNITTENVR